MRTVTKYIAYDDKEFDDEFECVEYEKTLHRNRLYGTGGYMLDENFCPTDEPSETFYLYIPNTECYNLINCAFADDEIYFGIGSNARGYFKWDCVRDEFVNLSDEVANLHHLIHKLQNITIEV